MHRTLILLSPLFVLTLEEPPPSSRPPPVLLLPPVVAPQPEQSELEVRCRMTEDRGDLRIGWEMEEFYLYDYDEEGG